MSEAKTHGLTQKPPPYTWCDQQERVAVIMNSPCVSTDDDESKHRVECAALKRTLVELLSRLKRINPHKKFIPVGIRPTLKTQIDKGHSLCLTSPQSFPLRNLFFLGSVFIGLQKQDPYILIYFYLFIYCFISTG